MRRRTLLAALPMMAAPSRYDVFLLAGQSNMAGRGVVEAQDRKPLARVFSLSRNLEWAPAIDPLHSDKPDIAGVGIGRSFAQVLTRENPKATIGLVPCAMGGSALDEWKPGEKLFVEAVKRGRHAANSGTLRGILWHQGEADSTDPAKAASYIERWTRFIEAFRRELGAPDLPVVVGQLGEFLYDRSGNKSPHARKVNEQLALIPLSVPRTAFVSAAGLKHKGDEVHFDTPSLREFGRRYALAYLALNAEWK